MVKNRYEEELKPQTIKCYLVYGRKNPSSDNEKSQLIVTRVYARNPAFAESKFWKVNRSLYKLKKANGRVLKIQEVGEKSNNKIKNYGIYFKYRSNVGTHNSYKEVRAISLSQALYTLFSEYASNHKVDQSAIKILKTCELNEDQLRIRNPRCLTWMKTENISYPLWKRTARSSEARYHKVFKTVRPNVYTTGKSVDL